VYGKRFDVRKLVPYAQLGLTHKSDAKKNDEKPEAQSTPLRGVEHAKESSDIGWVSDDELLDKLIKYVHIKGGGTITKDDTIWELCERFNRSRDYLVELALEEETKAINGQTFKSLNSSLQEDNGEPESKSQSSLLRTEPRFGKAGEDRPVETRMGTRSGKLRDQISYLVNSPRVNSAYMSSSQRPRFLKEHMSTRDKISGFILRHTIVYNFTNITLNMKITSFTR
jgi:hypothetical protein